VLRKNKSRAEFQKNGIVPKEGRSFTLRIGRKFHWDADAKVWRETIQTIEWEA
jgi:hypothetical protein